MGSIGLSGVRQRKLPIANIAIIAIVSHCKAIVRTRAMAGSGDGSPRCGWTVIQMIKMVGNVFLIIMMIKMVDNVFFIIKIVTLVADD